MTKQSSHIFTLSEAAMAYAMTAERLFGNDVEFLNSNPAVVPIFVSHLFQSLEISIKAAGIGSGLFTEEEARARPLRRGHGIKELANLLKEKLGAASLDTIVEVMTFPDQCGGSIAYPDRWGGSIKFIRLMICGKDLEKTRESYASHALGYGQVSAGDFGLLYSVSDWIKSVKVTASNLPKTIDYLCHLLKCPSELKQLMIGN
jgi:hypothetical protein